MDLVTWKPFGELSSFRKEMDNVFKKFFGEMPFLGSGRESWVPSVDIRESDEQVVVKAELPGLEAGDIDVSLSGDILTIKGEKKTEHEKKEEDKYHYSERYYGLFERSFRLPVAVKTDQIEATFEKGLLTITLPKEEEAKAKAVKIDIK